MNRFTTTLAAACFALAATSSFAQTAPQGRQDGPGRNPQMREAFKAAHEQCKAATDRRACMTQAICSKASEPAKCFEFAKARGDRMKQRAEVRQKMHEACNGKRGGELAACMKGQKDAFRQVRMEQRQKAHEACNSKRGDELISCLRSQPGSFGGRHHGHQRDIRS